MKKLILLVAIACLVFDQLNAAPLSGGQIELSQSTVCPGTSVKLQNIADASGGSGNYKYGWQTKNGDGWQNAAGDKVKEYTFVASRSDTYRRFVVDEYNPTDTAYSNEVTLTVFPMFQAGKIRAAAYTVCYNGSTFVDFETPPSGGSGNYTYRWKRSNDNGVTWQNVPQNLYNILKKTLIRCEVTDESCGVKNTSQITINVAETMTAGTISGPTELVCYGSDVVIENAVSGAGGAGESYYEWYQKTAGMGSFEKIPDASGASCVARNLTKETKFYRKYITDCGSVASPEITVKIRPHSPFDGGLISVASSKACQGASVVVYHEKAASGGSGAIYYSWQRKNSTGVWEPTGKTSPNYDFQIQKKNILRRAAIDACNDTVYSNEVTVNLYDPLQAGTIKPSDGQDTICSGKLSVLRFETNPSGGSGNYTYQWKKSVNNGATWEIVTGQTSALGLLNNITTNTLAYCEVTDACGTKQNTDTVEVVVRPDVPITSGGTISAPAKVCKGSDVTISSEATGVGGTDASYYWERKTLGSATWTAILDANEATYTAPNITTITYFRRKYRNGCGTGEATSNEITVGVYSSLNNGGTIAADKTDFCRAGGTVNFSNTTDATGGSGSYAYSWQQKNEDDEWIDIEELASATANISVTQTTTFRRVVTDTECGSVAYSNEIEITMHPQVEFVALEGSFEPQTVCSPHNIAPIKIQIKNGTPFPYCTSKPGGLTTFSDPASPDIYSFSGAPFKSGNIVIRAINACGDTISKAIKIVVHSGEPPVSELTARSAVCKHSSVTISETKKTNLFDGCTFQWRKSTDNGANWEDIDGATELNYTCLDLAVSTAFQRITTNACGNSNSSAPIIVNVYSPLDGGTITSDKDKICITDIGKIASRVTFVNEIDPSGGSGQFDYLWQCKTEGASEWQHNCGGSIMKESAYIAISEPRTIRRATIDVACGDTAYSNEIQIAVLDTIKIVKAENLKQTICLGEAIAPIEVRVENSSILLLSPAPSGLNATLQENDKVLQISGTPQTTEKISLTVLVSGSCDTKTLNVNIAVNQPTSGVDVQTHCDSFTWIDGVTYTESNNTATYTLTNVCGCDSVVTLNLTINPQPELADIVGESAPECEAQEVVYLVENIENCFYTWDVPEGAVIANGNGTNQITVNYGKDVDGEITVFATNDAECVSTVKTFTVATAECEEMPTLIKDCKKTVTADMRIYTLSGVDVTQQAGTLHGLHFVKIGNKTYKVILK